jgi:hypothetical protein
MKEVEVLSNVDSLEIDWLVMKYDVGSLNRVDILDES